MSSVYFRFRLSWLVHFLYIFVFLISATHADWWEHPHDKWYVKDDWKAAKVKRYSPVIQLQNPARSGWIIIWGDKGVELKVNGAEVMKHIDKGLIYDTDLTPYIDGATEIVFHSGPAGIVAEGEIIDENHLRYPFASGCGWVTPVTDEMQLEPAKNPYRAGKTTGAFHSAHNARLIYYNDEERGKSDISKNLARIEKLKQQSIFLLRRYRSPSEILSFDKNTIWRQAERYASAMTEEAENILFNVAIHSQKQGEYAQSIAMAREAALLISAAELAVHSAGEVERIERQIQHASACIELIREKGQDISSYKLEFEEIRNIMKAARREADLEDWGNVLKRTETAHPKIEWLNEKISSVWGAPIGEPDHFDEDRFGWLNARPLMGSDPSKLEFIFINSEADWIDLRGIWSFRLDPENKGEQKGWQLPDVLLRNWHEIRVPGPWERQGFQETNEYSPWDCPYTIEDKRCENKPYNGYAWYRREVPIPLQWKDKQVVLHLGKTANWLRLFLNGTSISNPQINGGSFVFPENLLKAGEVNTIAIQVYNHNNFGGILDEPVTLSVDGYQPDVVTTPGEMSWTNEYTIDTPHEYEHLVMYSSSMSPVIVFTADQSTFQFWGWDAKGFTRPQYLSYMSSNGLNKTKLNSKTQLIDCSELTEGWLLLSSRVSPYRSMALKKSKPVLLLLEQCPQLIDWSTNNLGFEQLSIQFNDPGAKIIIYTFPSDNEPSAQTCSILSKRLRSIPVMCSQIEKLDKKNLCGDFYLKYHYLDFPDIVGTPFERIAPVPQLLSYALLHNFPEIQADDIETTDYTSQYAPLRFQTGSETLHYSTPLVDKSKLLKGVGELFAKMNPKLNARGGLTEQQMFDDWQNWGFDHCRYAFAWNAEWDIPLQEGVGGPINEDPEVWQRLDDLVHEMTSRNIMAMLCYFFNEDQPQKDSKNLVRNSTRYWRMHPETRENVYELWRRIAERYADEPEGLIAYDFLNEPAYMYQEDWNQIIKDLTRIVRMVDKKHLIVIEAGDGWSQCEWFLWLEPTGDPNTIYSFHHYGKHWGYQYDEYYPGYQSHHEEEIEKLLEAILFGIKHNVPMHCGEFGVSMISPGEDHLVWLNDYLCTLERFGIGWNWWNWSGNNIYRTGLRAGDEISPNLQILKKWIEKKEQF